MFKDRCEDGVVMPVHAAGSSPFPRVTQIIFIGKKRTPPKVVQGKESFISAFRLFALSRVGAGAGVQRAQFIERQT
jgi:hypothetical protein